MLAKGNEMEINMYNIGICDDEKSTCTELENMIIEYKRINQIQIETEVWYTGESLCNDFKKNRDCDLIFLDIKLIKLSGIEVGNYIRNELEDYRTFIVYISSKTNYAMHLFKTQPFDFLVKPFNQKQVNDILDNAIKRWINGNQFFQFYISGKHQKIPYEDVLYFRSENRKIELHTRYQIYVFYNKLKDLFYEMPVNFMQIHQSFIINQDYIKGCTYKDVDLVNGEHLIISKRYRVEVRQKIKEYQRERNKRYV